MNNIFWGIYSHYNVNMIKYIKIWESPLTFNLIEGLAITKKVKKFYKNYKKQLPGTLSKNPMWNGELYQI